ncbi:MAG: MFS transporter [Deltaproteobacteria bacterium]|nr:MFS transporter [Deltaproteobacteria bacterium]
MAETKERAATEVAGREAAPRQGETFAQGRGRSGVAILVVMFLLYMLNYMDRNVMGAVAEEMKRSLSLTDAQIGWFQTAFLVCIAGFAIPAAFIVDRWSRRKGIAIMALIWSLATATTGLAGGFVALLLTRVAVGVGEAGYSSGGTAMLSAAFPADRRAKILGIFNASIPLGAALGTVLGGVIAQRTGSWSTPFFIFAVPGALLAAATLLLRDYQTVRSEATQGFGRALRTLLAIPTLRLTYLGFAMNVFVSSALLAWLPPYLSRLYGLDSAAAAKKAALVFVLALVGAPLGGFLADKWAARNPRGRLLSCATTSILAAVALAAALLLGKSAGGFACLALWGIFTVAYLAPGGAITQDVVHPGLRATSWGACVLSMYLLGGAYSPVIVGKLSDALGDIGQALLVAPVAGLAAAVLFLLAGRTYEEDRRRVEPVELVREGK